MSTQTILSGDQIKDLLSGDLADDYVLNSVYEIENVLLMLKSIKKKVDWFKDLKKHRADVIDVKISELEEKSERLRSVVLHTMKKLQPDHNSLNFPSIGAVTRKKPTTKWQVDDEEALVEFLDKSGYKDEVTRVKVSLDSRKLKKVLDDMSEARVDVPGATQIVGSETISVKYEEPKTKTKSVKEIEDMSQQADDMLDALDGISADDI